MCSKFGNVRVTNCRVPFQLISRIYGSGNGSGNGNGNGNGIVSHNILGSLYIHPAISNTHNYSIVIIL